MAEIFELLVRAGGVADKDLRSQHESWRIRSAGSVFTSYRSGSLYCNGGAAPELAFLYGKISEISGQAVAPPAGRLLVGLDETGKGEVLGHASLAAVKVRADALRELDRVIGSTDTKTRKSFQFWDELIQELDILRGRGFEYQVETLPPWDVDRYNVNKILDVIYQRLLARILHGENLASVRITIDDYGVGDSLERYLESLGRKR